MKRSAMVKGNHDLNEQIDGFVRRLLQELQQSGNNQSARKLQDLIDKQSKEQLHVGFCGLFSAGKSTMINALLEYPLLPSSPIPTSANVVQISFGPTRAVIHMQDRSRLELDINQLDQWKTYLQDGQEVTHVDIYHEHALLKDGLIFVDTPGIDSNDVQHQQATENALHVADVVFFICDYHHVQSEENMQFIKTLQEKGKTLCLVINQIDKHRQQEVSLLDFMEQVEHTLTRWDIHPWRWFMTSLTKSDDAYNQLDKLTRLISNLPVWKSSILEQHFIAMIKSLLTEQEHFKLAQRQEERMNIQQHIVKLKQVHDYESDPQLLQQFEEHEQWPTLWTEQIKKECQHILENAIITPYMTTRMAEAVIESYQHDFKVGLFFAKQKTIQEQEHRVQALLTDMNERMKAQMEWHLKEMLRQKMNVFELVDEQLERSISALSITLTKDILLEFMQQNVSNQFVYTYTNQVIKRIQMLYRHEVEAISLTGRQLLKDRFDREYETDQERISGYKKIREFEAQLEQEVQLLQQHTAEMLAELDSCEKQSGAIDASSRALEDGDKDSPIESLSRAISEADRALTVNGDQSRTATNAVDEAQIHAHAVAPSEDVVTSRPKPSFDRSVFAKTAQTLREGAQLLQQLPSLRTLVSDLQQRAQRLDDLTFRVCLFGAFSAGKSSLANALIRQPLLPSSPQPTTAAVNYLLPANNVHPAQSATVLLKSRERVWKDWQVCLKRLGLTPGQDVQDSFQRLDQVKPHELSADSRKYFSFLHAVRSGWAEMEPLLGKEIEADHAAFSSYVSEEHKACFVEDIRLYIQSAYTDAGLEMIDTPGADSVHARHTDVAFQFVKHADAIIYVTYYNHAFSRADRIFLEQLGQVKDQFALDKMFFIINAADLASSADELAQVKEHVQDQLQKAGIRFPRLFAVSSIEGLHGYDQGLHEFEEHFFRFIEDELAQLQIDSAHEDLRRGYRLLQELNHNLQQSQSDRENQIEQLLVWQKRYTQDLHADQGVAQQEEIKQEVQQLFYYVKQRIFFEFKRFVDDAFSPSVLTADQANKSKLKGCLQDLLFALLDKLHSECQVTGLRMERFIHRQQQAFMDRSKDKAEQEQLSLHVGHSEPKHWSLPDIPEQLPLDQHKPEQTLRHFRSPRQFFEQGGKETLRAELEEQLQQVADLFMQQVIDSYQSFYMSCWQEAFAISRSELLEEVQEAIEVRKTLLSGEVSVEHMQNIVSQYKRACLPD